MTNKKRKTEADVSAPPKEHLVEAKVTPNKDGKIFLGKEELDYLRKKDLKTAELYQQIGTIEFQILMLQKRKSSFANQLEDHAKSFEEWQSEFIKPKYGAGELNISTGEFFPDAKNTKTEEIPITPGTK